MAGWRGNVQGSPKYHAPVPWQGSLWLPALYRFPLISEGRAKMVDDNIDYHLKLIISNLHILEESFINHMRETPYGPREINLRQLQELREMAAAFKQAIDETYNHLTVR